MPISGRIMALDVGRRRIGRAVSDALGLTAQGLPTLQRQNLARDIAALCQDAQPYEIDYWLLGLPLLPSGDRGSQVAHVEELGARLQQASQRRVEYWDERFTSVLADQVLRSAGLSRNKRTAASDKLAAVLILQSYLDRQTLGPPESAPREPAL
jgi:putative Holliday junction resolvase